MYYHQNFCFGKRSQLFIKVEAGSRMKPTSMIFVQKRSAYYVGDTFVHFAINASKWKATHPVILTEHLCIQDSSH